MKPSETYYEIAKELGVPGATLDDFEPSAVQVAQEYAKRAHKAWPPHPVTPGWTVSFH